MNTQQTRTRPATPAVPVARKVDAQNVIVVFDQPEEQGTPGLAERTAEALAAFKKELSA